MRLCAILVPEWLAQAGTGLFDQPLPALTHMAEAGELFRLLPTRDAATPEAAFLGLDPAKASVEPGPLAVAAFGADPPSRSVHFHLSICSVVNETLHCPDVDIPAAELVVVLEAAQRLNTRALTMVRGEGLDHGLVWEDGSIELGTTPPDRAIGSYRAYVPEGDGEPLLRRFIDDSINLLSELELNQRRMEEGLPPFSCLWPWGHGFRPSLPNLALIRGEVVMVASRSIRLAGLSRLVGYRHGDRRAFGKGTAIRLDTLAPEAKRTTVCLIEEIETFRREGQMEEAAWLTREIGTRLLVRLVDAPKDDPVRVLLLAPGMQGGLGMDYRSNAHGEGRYPFDERSLEEPLPMRELWEVVDEALKPTSL